MNVGQEGGDGWGEGYGDLGGGDLMGMISPRTGAPSMISYFARVSDSLRALLPEPVDSRRRISTSMCFSFILTCKHTAAVEALYSSCLQNNEVTNSRLCSLR